jgi:hypothetical protein
LVDWCLFSGSARCRFWLLLVALGASGPALAQTEEIKVFDASIAGEGQFEAEFHNNYTPIGRTEAGYPGGVVPNQALNGVPELAYGVTPWLEAGLYFPVYTFTSDGRAELDAGKVRALFVSPFAANRALFYGVNFELSYNAAHWAPTRFAGEVRPILGWHIKSWDLIINPIVDTDFKGLGRLDFAPCERIAYHFSPVWAAGLEHYADFGPIDGFETLRKEGQTMFAVVDYRKEESYSVEAGIGHGFTEASDALVLKLMIGVEF